MKDFKQRLQRFGERAQQIRHIVETAPAKAAELSQTVLHTADQLQQLKSDVQNQIVDFKARDPEHLSRALQEITGHTQTIRKAGYDIAGLEVELEPVQRLIVQLQKREDVPESTLRSLLAAHPSAHVLTSLLQSLLQAELFADHLAIPGMQYGTLRVAIGPVPSIRLAWAPERSSTEARPGSSTPQASPASPSAPSSFSTFGTQSFFEARSYGSSPSTPASAPNTPLPRPTPPDLPPPQPSASPTPIAPSTGSVLDRFKKMPDLGKRS